MSRMTVKMEQPVADFSTLEKATSMKTWIVAGREIAVLAPSDQMITRTRRRLLMAARALRDAGVSPPGVEDARAFCGARGGYFVSDDNNPWQEIYRRQLAAAVYPRGALVDS
jgi:hypothetical protein